MYRILIFIVCFLLATAGANAQTQSRPLTNEDIVKLVQAGLGEEIILAMVAGSPTTEFVLTPAALIQLKMAKVNNKIIAAMISPASPLATASAFRPATVSTSSAARVVAAPARPNAMTPVSSRTYRIFVRAEDESGFADKELDDSARDIRGRVKAPAFQVVSTEDDANVLLIVVKREIKVGEPSHARVFNALSSKQQQQINDVYATLSVRRDGKWVPGIKLSSNQCCGAWRPAADEVIKQAHRWLDQNYR